MKTLQDYIKLAESATDGPWESFYEGSGDFALYQISNGKQNIAHSYEKSEDEIATVSGPDSCMFGGQQSEKNAQFIAASRTLGPAMAKALIEAEEALHKAQRCLTIYQQADVALDLNAALSQIRALNGGE